jgi:AcrR family transcriptional regulator
MPVKRSRAETEQRFQDAVVELVAESGCGNLGINVVAQRAGSDKVLIYRYFGGLEPLLERVAQSRSWLPEASELLASAPGDPFQTLSGLSRALVRHIRSDRATHQVSRWRHAARSPLTEQFNSDWRRFWKEASERLGHGLSFEGRELWRSACSLLALAVQAELNDEGIELRTLERLAENLESNDGAFPEADSGAEDDSLPTNLL